MLAVRNRRSIRKLTFHLEATAKLLILLGWNPALFSKRELKSLNNQTDFDSAIRRFDPSRPSQLILLNYIDSSLLHLEMANSAARRWIE
jgi:hypothetical protein